MKNRLSCKIFMLLMSAAGGGCSSLYADVIWNGGSVSNVFDEDLTIEADVVLPAGPTIIEASHRDVIVDIDQDLAIRGNPSGESQLYLIPHFGRTIRFKLDHTVTFYGSANETFQDPLIIIHGNQGRVIFELEGGDDFVLDTEEVTTTGEEPVTFQSGGVEYYVLLADEDEYSRMPQTIFQRRSGREKADKDRNVKIEIHKNCLLGFLSHSIVGDNEAEGAIAFDPSTGGEGRMILDIRNAGAVLVYPRRSSKGDALNITSAEIHKEVLAGGQAMLQVINGSGDTHSSGLLVTNRNERMSQYLYDPFLNLEVRKDDNDYRGNFEGNQYGFVVGSNGILDIQENSYFDYVALALNKKYGRNRIRGFDDEQAEELIKKRNPSALIFDQSLDPFASHPMVNFGETSALFVRSGVDKKDHVKGVNDKHAFTVRESRRTEEVGNYVVDIEGEAEFVGPDLTNGSAAKIELLSLEVDPEGGPLFVGGSEDIFPLRTFAHREDGELYAYNLGAFLINGRMNLKNVSLSHTDENAIVLENDDVLSEPVYVGGETFKLLRLDDASLPVEIESRPKITFVSSRFLIHTDVALTGVDLLVPNRVEVTEVGLQNLSQFVFASNGRAVDDGTGRRLILGTLSGATAQDGVSIVDSDAHLDVMQTEDVFDIAVDPNAPDGDHTLQFITTTNDNTITEEIGDADISDQVSIHSIFLGNNSNISIGTNADDTGFFENTSPWLRLSGDFFAFESSGGPLDNPASSLRTAKGAIFVDLNGRFSIDPEFDATMGAMVVRSRNAITDLPVGNVYFEPGVGIAPWVLNFDPNDIRTRQFPYEDEYDQQAASDLIVVAADEVISDFTIDWLLIRQNNEQIFGRCMTRELPDAAFPFVPYPVDQIQPGFCPPVTENNITNVPIIEGEVGQLQIAGSRLGDPAHIKIRGGFVREIVFQDTGRAGEAPVAIIILEEGGRVGIGSANTNSDSVTAARRLGHNGVIIIGNRGGGQVILNEGVVIEGQCPFLFGPDIQPGETVDVISESGDIQQIAIRAGGTFDLNSIAEGGFLDLGADIRLSVEAGSLLLFGEAEMGENSLLRLRGNSRIDFLPANTAAVNRFFADIPLGSIDNTLSPTEPTDASLPHNEFAPLINFGEGLNNTDQFRTRIVGVGTIELSENAQINIPAGAIVGVETIDQLVGDAQAMRATITRTTTDLTIRLLDAAQFNIGNAATEQRGGVFQIGNVEDRGSDHSISFQLELNGAETEFNLGSGAVLGLGAGVANLNVENPSQLLINPLYNVDNISIIVNAGTFDASRIFTTDDARANVILIGENGVDETTFTFTVANNSSAVVRGGSPLVLVNEGTVALDNMGLVSPIVRGDSGPVQIGTDAQGNPIFSTRIEAGMFASSLLQDLSVPVTNLSAEDFFAAESTQDALDPLTPAANRANAGSVDQVVGQPEVVRIGTIIDGQIVRQDVSDIFSPTSTDLEVIRQEVVEQGAVLVDIDAATGQILDVAQIQ